jgi:hypothetical protein
VWYLVASGPFGYECIPNEYFVVTGLVGIGISDVDMADGILGFSLSGLT